MAHVDEANHSFSMFDSRMRRRREWVGRKLFNNVACHRTKIHICNYLYNISIRVHPFFYIPNSKISIIDIFLIMHTFFLLVACLSATIATPVAQLFDLFAEDAAVTINNKQDINNLPQGFGTGELEYLSTELQQLDENDAPPSFAGDATTNYLQAQVPSQGSFSNFGAQCPSGELFCCQGGSGLPGSLFTDDAFSAKCISCTSHILSKGYLPALFC